MIKTVRGFNDWYGEKGKNFLSTYIHLAEFFTIRGYQFIELPLVEDRSLYTRSSGMSDVVSKEMFEVSSKGERLKWEAEQTVNEIPYYSIQGLMKFSENILSQLMDVSDEEADNSDRINFSRIEPIKLPKVNVKPWSWVLRPEATAQVVRMFLNNKLDKNVTYHSQKFFYFGPMFRYERPQWKRYRQFYSFGIEYFYQEKYIDRYQTIKEMLGDTFELLNKKNVLMKYNFLPSDILAYSKDLKEWLLPRKEELGKSCQERLNNNVIRVFDCKEKKCQELLKNAPEISLYYRDDEKELFDAIKQICMSTKKIQTQWDHRLVRGLDYYNGFVFEMIDLDEKRKEISFMGGGEYNNLVKKFDHESENWNAIGFGIGFERILSILKQVCNNKKVIIAYKDETHNEALIIRDKLIKMKLIVNMKYTKKNIGREIEWANKNEYENIVFVTKQSVANKEVELIKLKDFTKERITW